MDLEIDFAENTDNLVKVEEDCIDLDSDDTDYSEPEDDFEEEEEVVELNSSQDTDPPSPPPPLKEEPLNVPAVTYSNAKYFKKQRTVITEIVENKEISSEPCNRVYVGSNIRNLDTTTNLNPASVQENGRKRKLCDEMIKAEYREMEIRGENGEVLSERLASVKVESETEKEFKEDIKTVANETDVKDELDTDWMDVKIKEEFNPDEFGPREEKSLRLYNKMRTWWFSKFGSDLNSGEKVLFDGKVRFRVLTYNILSPTSLEKQRHLYKNKKSFLLSWEYRLTGIKREIESLNPDIICFQEIDFIDSETVNDDILEFLHSRGFSYKGTQRTGGKTDGCAIFFKNSIFQCEEHKLVKFKREELTFLSGNSVGVICRFKVLNTPQRLVVGTVHLQYGERKHLTRLAQAAIFLAELDELVGSRNIYYPCILAGDFNLESYTDVHRLLTKGYFQYKDLPCGKEKYPKSIFPAGFGLADNLRWIRTLGSAQYTISSGSFHHEFGFRSVYRYREERDLYMGFAPPENEVTAYQGKYKSVDHIFYSTQPANWDFQSIDGRMEKYLKLLGKWTLPTGSEISKLGGLPSTISPSDHLPLAADFLITAR